MEYRPIRVIVGEFTKELEREAEADLLFVLPSGEGLRRFVHAGAAGSPSLPTRHHHHDLPGDDHRPAVPAAFHHPNVWRPQGQPHARWI